MSSQKSKMPQEKKRGRDTGGKADAGASGSDGGRERDNKNQKMAEHLNIPRELHCDHYFLVESGDDDFYEDWVENYRLAVDNFRGIASGHRLFEENPQIYQLNDEPRKDFMLGLHNSDRDWVILHFQCNDMYLRGFTNRTKGFPSFRFSDMTDTDGKKWNDLGFNSNYGRLGTFSVGMKKLQHCFRILSKFSSEVHDYISVSQSLLIMAITFAEAGRFKPVFDFIAENMLGNNKVPSDLVEYIQNWARCSKYLIAAKSGDVPKHDVDRKIKDSSFLSSDGTKAESVEHLKSVILTVSNQSVEDSVRIIAQPSTQT